jgi:hypothetical protein
LALVTEKNLAAMMSKRVVNKWFILSGIELQIPKDPDIFSKMWRGQYDLVVHFVPFLELYFPFLSNTNFVCHISLSE